MKKELTEFLIYLIDTGVFHLGYIDDPEKIVHEYLKTKEAINKYMTKKP